MASNKKPIAVSGIQASGNLHIGNYIGAIKQFVDLQDEYHLYAFIADLHAITVPQDPATLRKNTLETVALYLASGLDPKKATIFVQSHIPSHVELGWIFNTITPLGELERMTQFKDKLEKGSVFAGLLNYPTLMAADILMYNPDIVPVGKDQLQHLELTREIARKFNARFGETFREPKAVMKQEGAYILGLDDPTKKMSKSAESEYNYIALLDTKEIIEKKIKSAVTDSGKEITYNPEAKPAISNLLTIYSAISGRAIPELETTYREKSYAEFKSDLAVALVEALSPIQKKYHALMKDQSYLMKVLRSGAEQASAVAETIMHAVRSKVGLLEQQ